MKTNRLYVAAALSAATSAIAVVAAFAAAPAPAPTPRAVASAASAAPAAPMESSASVAPVTPTPTLAPPAAPAPQLTPQQSEFFETKVRPIFVKSCYKCHSIEQGKSKGGLLLDSREGWMKGGDNGAAVLPGDPAHSRLLLAVSYTDPDLQMPPKGEKLSAAEIADLTAWVKMGAPDPRVSTGVSKLTGLNDKARAHWAYQPVKQSPIPDVKDKAWAHTPIDAFVLAKLEQNGLTPSRAASREVLIRRATYDLTGLPPTPEEVRAFVIDHSPNAWEKVIDRLLASSRYGERWGRYWLDTARYADTTGNDANKNEDYRYEYAWTYRDWVIKAFNSDLPYDQFLKDQIAADLLPGADKDPDRLAALGFLTVGKRFANKNDTIDERIDAVTKATMALTVSCARCHDHKFDPIPTADYYSLHGVFNSLTEPDDKPLVGKQPTAADRADFEKKRAELLQKNRDAYYEVVAEQSGEFRKKAAGYILTSLYSVGPHKDSAKKLDAVKEYDLAGNKGNGQLLVAARVERRGHPVFAPFQWFAELPPEQFSQKAGDVLARIAKGEMPPGGEFANKSGKIERKKGYLYIEPIKGDVSHVNPRVVAAFKNVSPSSLHNIHDVAEVYGKLFASLDGQAKAFLEANRKGTGKTVTGFDDATVQILETPFPIEPAGELTDERLHEVSNGLALGNTAYTRFLFSEINELTLTHPGSPGRAMVVADLPKPIDSPIFIRGDQQTRGKIVPRQFLEVLSGPNREAFKTGSGRLELAQDIGSRSNPLTARVLVNRVWMHHFGEGIVRTPDDLGVQSEPPSHPELLDYLASRFMEEGWSIKKLHKQIMLSSAYQQSSDTNPAYAKIDPGNHFLWRANLRRLDFEAIRDTLLMFTGKLDFTLGGKPVNLTDEPYSNRRSVYGYVDRGRLPELMGQFDFSDPNRPNSRRTTTIVPQQALFFMNSPMSADVARKVCSRPEFQNAKDDYSRVRALYEVLYQRDAKPSEVQLAAQFYNESVTSGAAGSVAGASKAPLARTPGGGKSGFKLNKPGNNARASIQNEGTTVDRKPLTTWELYAQALLFTNEIAYVN